MMDLHDTDDDFGARTVSRPNECNCGFKEGSGPGTHSAICPARYSKQWCMKMADIDLQSDEGLRYADYCRVNFNWASREIDRLLKEKAALTKELDTAKAFTYWVELERDKLQELYNDLLMQVASKHPNETRHETAKRYIVQAEAVCSIATKGDSDEQR